MTQPLRTCTHTYDTGRTCNSVAAKDQKYCRYHLGYRARQLRLAQARARAERFDFKLPPLEDMYAVQSALSQLAEALAADMIDLKRAHALMSVLRLMSLNFRHPEKWQTNLYHSDQLSEVDVAREYGLPNDLDLDTPPQAAFPQSENDLSSRAKPAAAGEVEGPAFSMGGPQLPDVGNCGNLQTDNPQVDFRPDSPISPEWLELRDVRNTQGDEAQEARFHQLERNRARRDLRLNRKRYADLAMRLNVKWAAERLAEHKVAEKLKEAGIAPAEAEAKDFDTRVAEEMKKMAAGDAEIDAYLAGQEVKIA
jgi:hypothetical protein